MPEMAITNDMGGRAASALAMPRLSKRLAAVAALVPDTARVVDIGSDHGYLAAWLYLNGRPSVTAADINRGPLDSAMRTAAEYGIEDRLSFALSDGFEHIDRQQIDCAVIAGMGGETIAGIVSQLSADERRRISLVLQPQSKYDELFAALEDMGYGLIDALAVTDAGRTYIAFSVGYTGEGAQCDPVAFIAQKGGDAAALFIKGRIFQLEKELMGHRHSGRHDEAAAVTARLQQLKTMI